MPPHRTVAALSALAVLAAACGGSDTDPGSDPRADEAAENLDPAEQLVAQVASFDLAVGEDQRFLVGLFDGNRGVLGGGEVQVRVGFLGQGRPGVDDQVEMSDAATATFLPVPGSDPEVGDTPDVIEGGGAGVYQTRMDFDRAGNWGAQVTFEREDGPVTTTTVFPVAEQHRVPAVGDPAPRTDNPTIESEDVAPVAIDSRAQGEDGEIPDPELHDASIADVLDAGRPMVVVISTPVYCVSQFCGPITEFVAGLAGQYDDRAEFVHLEVWQDFDAEELTPATEEWIFDPQVGGNEPWVFLVGADGTIQARWDNVLDGQDLTSRLEALPTG